MYFYSKSANGFFRQDIHGSAIPSDAVQITEEQHRALMEGQAVGKKIKGDSKGNPVLE